MSTGFIKLPSEICLTRASDMPQDRDVIVLHRKITEHKKELDGHLREQHKINSDHARMHCDNMQAIAALTTATQGVVDAWSTAHNLRRFAKWLSGFAVVGAVVYWIAAKLNIII